VEGRDEQFGTFKITIPPIRREIICTASPTDLSLVVIVVSKPMSRIMMVEKELTTPLGMALILRLELLYPHFRAIRSKAHRWDLRSKNTGEDKNGLGVRETSNDLSFVKMLVLNTSFIVRDTLNSNQSLAMVEEDRIGR
jgi:hypothetical protein